MRIIIWWNNLDFKVVHVTPVAYTITVEHTWQQKYLPYISYQFISESGLTLAMIKLPPTDCIFMGKLG